MATVTVRNLGPNYDPLWGSGQNNYLEDLAAVAQMLLTRLKLFQGEWWADLADGLPLFQQILGKAANVQQFNVLLAQRILGTRFVTGINSVSSSFDSVSQKFSYTASVQTQFGALTVTNEPTPPLQSLPQV